MRPAEANPSNIRKYYKQKAKRSARRASHTRDVRTGNAKRHW